MRFIIVFIALLIMNTAHAEPLNYLNNIRTQAGLNPLTLNNTLTKSATNHAIYIYAHKVSGHYQDKNKKYFTGYAPVDRAVYVGYPSLTVLENVSDGQASYKESIDGLMSAIYHRFGFLSLKIDEIGFADRGGFYTYNMGNSKVRELCETNFEIKGTYYKPCANKSKMVPKDDFDNANTLLQSQLNEIVLYPVAFQKDVQTVFYEESPDPLPDMSISGYPVSVQFNDLLVKEVKFESFKLYQNCQDEVVRTRILNKQSDPNKMFTAHEFALFPLDRLKFGTRYCVDFKYRQKGEIKAISWSFDTENLENIIDVVKDEKFTIDSGKTYHFNIKPWDVTKILNSVNYNYTDTVKIEQMAFLDHYVLAFKATGKSGDLVNIMLDKRKIELTIR